MDPPRGVPEEGSAALCPSPWQRGQEEGPGFTPSPPILCSIWQLCVPAGPPTVGTCVPLASGEEVKRSVEMRPRAWQRWCCHQAQSALGPDDVTGPQTLPATWTTLSFAPEWQRGGGGREEESLVCEGRERGCAGPAVSPRVLCEPTDDGGCPSPPATPRRAFLQASPQRSLDACQAGQGA